MVGIDYQLIMEEVRKKGIARRIIQRAKELQTQLSEPNCPLPYEDAVEMAYTEHKELQRLY